MSIRKKLIVSNILMILIPALLTLTFAAVIFKTYGNRYWESLEEMYDDKDGVYSAQSIVYAYKEALTDETWVEYVDTDGDGTAGIHLNHTNTMDELEKDLSGLGYHFWVKVDGKTMFSSITEDEEEKIEEYFEDSYERIGNLTLSEEQGSIIKNSFEKDGNSYEITAVHLDETGTNKVTVSYFRRYVTDIVLWAMVFVIAVICVTNAALSRWIVWSIMRPLEALKGGTKKIAAGDLDCEIDYHKPDEFGEVCQEFDFMRGQLKASVADRIQYEQYRRELIAGISHDLRTPLTSIKGYAEGLKDGIANTEEKRQRYYDAIHTRALDMEALVNSLSLFARLENRKHHYQLETVDMKVYLEDLLDGWKEEAAQKQVVLLLDSQAARTQVQIDLQEMHRVFVNLFENSVKYRTKDKSVIRITLGNQGNQLEIRVADDGPGVQESELSKIFNSFYRGDESRTRPGSGSGLGLAIVKQIVEGHGGTIRAVNDRGLTTIITIPLDLRRAHHGKKEGTEA